MVYRTAVLDARIETHGVRWKASGRWRQLHDIPSLVYATIHLGNKSIARHQVPPQTDALQRTTADLPAAGLRLQRHRTQSTF